MDRLLLTDSLPEWSVDDAEDIGTFDSSGAFMSLKVSCLFTFILKL